MRSGFFALRLALGVAEAGYYPGSSMFLSKWITGAEFGQAYAIITLGSCTSGILGGPLAMIFLSMDNVLGLRGWQWLFLVEGIPTVVLGLAFPLVVPRSPSHAKWLTPAEARWLESRAQQSAREKPGHSTKAPTWESSLAAVKAAATYWRVRLKSRAHPPHSPCEASQVEARLEIKSSYFTGVVPRHRPHVRIVLLLRDSLLGASHRPGHRPRPQAQPQRRFARDRPLDGALRLRLRRPHGERLALAQDPGGPLARRCAAHHRRVRARGARAARRSGAEGVGDHSADRCNGGGVGGPRAAGDDVGGAHGWGVAGGAIPAQRAEEPF